MVITLKYTLTVALVLTPAYLITVGVDDIVALDHTQRHAVGGTPMDGGSARRRDLHLTTHNTHNRQTSLPPEEFKAGIPASERL
jgi:hypothetical protein